MQADRLLPSLMLAQTREVSTRTALRDIELLATSGVLIWSNRGRNGGFQLREGWSTGLTGLAGLEANALAELASAAT
jgi:predicted DNA-binding transcriptional regulator YafY